MSARTWIGRATATGILTPPPVDHPPITPTFSSALICGHCPYVPCFPTSPVHQSAFIRVSTWPLRTRRGGGVVREQGREVTGVIQLPRTNPDGLHWVGRPDPSYGAGKLSSDPRGAQESRDKQPLLLTFQTSHRRKRKRKVKADEHLVSVWARRRNAPCAVSGFTSADPLRPSVLCCNMWCGFKWGRGGQRFDRRLSLKITVPNVDAQP